MDDKLELNREEFAGEAREFASKRLRLGKLIVGKTQKEIALAIGATVKAVGNWCAGSSRPSRPEHVMGLAKLFKCDAAWILNGEGNGPRKN
jgi:transcriptional regulator with XRE-family HTH domain